MTPSSNERARGLRRIAAVVGLLAVYYVLAISAASRKSMTFDEMAHLTAGYTYWTFDDYRLHPENGNLPQRLGALPSVLGRASFPTLDQPAWTSSNVYAIGDQFLYSSGNDADTLLRRSRAVMALVGVALGALIYSWARRLVSPAGAGVSVLLFVFSPTFLAHGPLVTSDMAAALFFTAAAGAIWVALHRMTPMTVLGAAAVLGGAFLSKLSAPILIPVAVVMTLVRLIDGRPLTVRVRGRSLELTNRAHQVAIIISAAVIVGLVTWTLIWASFGFRYAAFAAATTGKDAFLGQISTQPGATAWALSAARRLHLLPEAYLYGSALTVQFAAERAAFLNGEFSTTGWWWYFPYAFAVKTTIPGMIVGLLALAALLHRWRHADAGDTRRQRAAARLYAGTPLLALVAVYGIFALTSSLNIGHRHLLPIYPAFMILSGAAAFWVQPLFERTRTTEPQNPQARRKHRSGPRSPQSAVRGRVSGSRSAGRGPLALAGIATVAVLAWHVAESIAIRPDYLAYFNQLAGGPSKGYRHLADSSLDWGQDLPALKQWLDREGLQRAGAGNVYLSYFGTARPDYYGIKAIPLAGFIDRRPPQPPDPLRGGVYCISATVLDVIGPSFYKPQDEGNYQAALQNLIAFARASENEASWSALLRQTGEQYWHDLFKQFDQLRTGRLVAFLRNRQPDAMVGYSILIYRLTDADVALAVGGPATGGPR
jgi:dolichyl-phosphate-mannose-protein mannosyltransferase